MKKLIALLLAVCLLTIPVSAETFKSEVDTGEEAVITIGEGGLAEGEMEVVTVHGEEVLEDMEIVQYADEAPVEGEEETVTVYGEEESGFFGWLKNLWNSILHFFGL